MADTLLLKNTKAELAQIFWASSNEAYFDQISIASVTGRAPKTLEYDRWKKQGIPYRKVGGKILYKKCDVVQWLEKHEVIYAE